MNNTYILLRNNSESTPLSLEDLKRIGLLPTDLLWVECQSVYWQSPQDIPSLKHLMTEAAQPAINPPTDEPWDKYIPYVENETSADTENYNSLNKKKEGPIPAKQEGSTSEMKTANRINAPQTELLESLRKLPLKKIALYTGLVAAGALMMLVIRGIGSNEPMISQPGSQQTKTATTTPVKELATDRSVTAETYDQENIPVEQITTVPAEEQVISAPGKKEATVKNESTKKETTPLNNETPADYPAAVAEKKEVKKVPVENIASKLQLKFNEYTVAAFGGIRDLKMTLQNNSQYMLDKVSVELHYLNPEGTVVKTETIDFNFVEPGAEATVAVKKSSRGVKLDYKITRIESKEMAAANSVAGENDQFSKN